MTDKPPPSDKLATVPASASHVPPSVTGYVLGKAIEESKIGQKLSASLGGAPASLALGVLGKMAAFMCGVAAPSAPAEDELDPKSLAAILSGLSDGVIAHGTASMAHRAAEAAKPSPLVEEAMLAKAEMEKREKRARRRLRGSRRRT